MNTQRSVVILGISLALTVTLTVLIALEAPRDDVHAAVLRPIRPTLSINPSQFHAQFDLPPQQQEREIDKLIEDLTEQAYNYWRNGQKYEAEELFRNVLLWDMRPGPLQAVGQLAFLDHRYNEALNFFAQFRDYAPERIEAHTNLAAALICLKRFDEASEAVNHGFSLLGDQFPGPFHFMWGCIAFHTGDLEEADRKLAEAHALLGPEMNRLVNSHWSRGLQELPSYPKTEL